MLVNNEIIQELYEDAGSTRVEKARLYMRTGRTEIEKINYDNPENFEKTGKVTEQYVYIKHKCFRHNKIE